MENSTFLWPKQPIPFRVEQELNSELQIFKRESDGDVRLGRTAPDATLTLPGDPFVGLDLDSIHQFLERSMLTTKLDSLAPYLWLVSTQSSSSISALHKQKILGRDIIITDSADLHLLWYHYQIFLKPLPQFMLCHAFWEYMFVAKRFSQPDRAENLYRASIGFIRIQDLLSSRPE
jgi:hypothetical protein